MLQSLSSCFALAALDAVEFRKEKTASLWRCEVLAGIVFDLALDMSTRTQYVLIG